MSGIVGIVNLDGSPVDRDLLSRMTNFMSYRGPDAQELWIDGNVGFGHTMLRTTWEAEHETQPLTLDGSSWLTADARIDGRAELIAKLEKKLGNPLPFQQRKEISGLRQQTSPNDAELILLAYQAWNTDCVNHLIGDFAFAIWDGRLRRLFCARDHFGFKPFYYSQNEKFLVFSNTLNCLRLHPGISNQLDDAAIADFLLFGFNRTQTTTSFKRIGRLAPANCLVLSGSDLRHEPYWKPDFPVSPIKEDPTDYLEQYRSLLQTAVSDRLRTNKVGIKMSGGVDSTTVAAFAREVVSLNSAKIDLRAFTVVYDSLFPDQERHFSSITANALGIPIAYLPADAYKPFERWNQPAMQTPEPVESYFGAVAYDADTIASQHTRVLIGGLGGDGYSLSLRTYILDRLRNHQFSELWKAYGSYLLAFWDRPSARLLNSLKIRLGLVKRQEPTPFPHWLNEALVEELKLRDRWSRLWSAAPAKDDLRAWARAAFSSDGWATEFEGCDPGVTNLPVEYRQPLFDIRLVSYSLSLPPVPNWLDKRLLRSSSRGLLPKTVRLRPKTTPLGDPVKEYLRQPEAQWIDGFRASSELERFVVRDRIPAVTRFNYDNVDESGTRPYYLHLRPLALNKWMEWTIK
jgi:asparagine synthase (glutamine-hydrolysing)